MINTKNTVIIIGQSPYLDNPEVYNNIYYLQHKFHTVGINQASILYRTEYFAFVDVAQRECFNHLHYNTKVISTDRNINPKFQGDYYKTDKLPLSEPPFNNETYTYYGFTHDICISWVYMKGFENVVLLGVADFTEDKRHADSFNQVPLYKKDFEYSEMCKKSSIEFIENVQKYINVYTVNPDSILSVPKITIDKLLLTNRPESDSISL